MNLKDNKRKTELVHLTPSLICSLYTLAPNDDLFKVLNLSKMKNDVDLYLPNFEIYNKLLTLCNKKFIKKLAFNIAQPLLQKDLTQRQLEQRNQKIRLLKQYLQRYKHTYYRFFSTTKYTNVPKKTKQELNILAIQALFIIIGT